MKNKRKKATSVVALAMAATLMLGGTYAWQSISQTALNEKEGTINPGGRLHDDFNGTNKDVYVENFASEKIFARVRLDEYFEFINNKGNEAAATTHIVTVGATKGDTSTYHPHLFDSTNATDAYWELTTGGSTTYMPTFNKNKDSLKADINGTFAQNYEDYVDYTITTMVTDDAVYDNDANSIEDDNTISVEETHHAIQTSTGTLISMAEWLVRYNNEESTDNYWVYDTDGWVYWSSPIESNTATGLLLDGIAPKQKFDDSYYYAINVVGQFITADDAGKGNSTGFYSVASEAPSASAETLLRAIGVDLGEAPSFYVGLSADKSWFIPAEDPTDIHLTVYPYYNDNSLDSTLLDNVSWRIEGNSDNNTKLSNTTKSSATLSIPVNEINEIKVYVTASYAGIIKEGSTTIKNYPFIYANIFYNENNAPGVFNQSYVAGQTNVYTIYYYPTYKGDIYKYDISEAYTGAAATTLAGKMSYTIDSEALAEAGITISADKNVVTVTVPEDYTDTITFGYTTPDGYDYTMTLKPAATSMQEVWNSSVDNALETNVAEGVATLTYTPQNGSGIGTITPDFKFFNKNGNVLNGFDRDRYMVIPEVVTVDEETTKEVYCKLTSGSDSYTIEQATDNWDDYDPVGTKYGKFYYIYPTGGTRDDYVAKISSYTGYMIINEEAMASNEKPEFTVSYKLKVYGDIVNTYTVNVNVKPINNLLDIF